MIATFSRGFQIPNCPVAYVVEEKTGVVVVGDHGSNELHAKIRDPNMRDMPFGLSAAILANASSTFGDLAAWFKHNLHNNPHISGYRAGYLVDTMGYIMTGKRSMDNDVWISMILDQGNPSTAGRFKVDRPLYEGFFKMSGTQMLQNWASHDGGVGDLARFMFICFGHEIATAASNLLKT